MSKLTWTLSNGGKNVFPATTTTTKKCKISKETVFTNDPLN
jgi:hypothetical protein